MTTKRIIKKIHPVAKLFPMHGDAKFAELVASIKQNGLLIPIPRDPNGVLLGGRNRLKACEVAGVEPRFETYDGDPVQFILSDNIARRQMSEGQCAIIFALAYPEPEKGGRGKSTNYSKLEWFSASRLSEARKIIKNSREMAKEVIAGTISFKEALDEATAVRIINTDPLPPGTPTIFQTGADLTAALAAKRGMHPNEMAAAKHRSEIDNERSRERLRAHFAQQNEAGQTEPDTISPGRTKEGPVEQWLFDWGDPDGLADRVIAADKLQPGYAQKVVDAIREKWGAPTRH